MKSAIKYETKIKIGYIGALLFLLISFLFTFYINHRLTKNTKMVEHTNNIIYQLEIILSNVKDGETGFRGYLVSGNRSYLESYIGSRKSADSILRNLKKLIADNKVQVNDLQALNVNIEKKYSFIENSLKTSRYSNQFNSPGMLDSLLLSKSVMNNIREIVNDMQNREKKLLILRNNELNNTAKKELGIAIASIIISLLLMAFGFYAHLKENKEKIEAEKSVLLYQEELKAGFEELAKANLALIQMRRGEKFAATGRIARTIAHEIRNPLTNINLAADQLVSELAPNDANADFLFDMITRNSTRINQLISNLLDATKFSELNYEKITINKLLDETLLQATDRITLNNVTVIKKYSEDFFEIGVDKEKIKIAFLNIIINAIESMEGKQKPELTIETKKAMEKCVVIISDNGVGMDLESQSKLFEPYFTSKPKGNGLGLTNTQNIIFNHKGSIFVKSEEGTGTSFTITLDIA